MSLRNLVSKNVDLAFRAIGDLALDVKFIPHTVTEFDFGTKTHIEEANIPAYTMVKCVKLELKKKSKTRDSKITQLLFKKRDLPDPTRYDSIEMNGVIWKIGDVYEDNDYTITLDIHSEN